VTGCQFAQWLVDQQPKYDKLIIEDIRPTDGFIGHVEMGTFEAWSGTQHTRDRFNNVYPDTTQAWEAVTSGSCIGTPCDFAEHTIGWGSTRLVYGLEKQSWQTPLLCFDQEMHITHAREQFRYIISKILKPATAHIFSQFVRKRGLFWVDNKIVANNTLTPFTFAWTQVTSSPPSNNLSETFFDCNIPPTSVFKLTPQHLQRFVEPLLRVGYLGEMPWQETRPPMLELISDTQTIWELDRLGGTTGYGGVPSVTGNWRFEQWESASKYWTYGFAGQLGNYTVKFDDAQLRFNFVTQLPNGLFRYQIVLPYVNVPSSGAGGASGLKSINNPAFDNAQYAISYIWHPRILQILVSDATPVNPEMPNASRNFAGRWQFVMDNLGADINGNIIANKRRNKGQFIADFKQAAAPYWTEFGVAWFHRREPSCIPNIAACNADPGYPAQSYSSDPGFCPTGTFTLLFTPLVNGTNGDFELEANTVTCDGVAVQHTAISGSKTLTALVAQLNQNNALAAMGTWSVVGAQIQVVGTCQTVSMPWVV